MTIITFVLEAEEEMNISAQYYNQQASGLGLDFLKKIEKSLEYILKDPERWPIAYKNIHKYNIRRFPFSLYYVFEKNKDKIIILAVAHQRRKPEYWKKRIK
ncbi:MAG: type II toxin-antitoxin system RelE/ParE family toxin [Candidatus Lokiarchaeota archaeon]|nr:type II toxin-antitoxin system RelE/ParE family toxin [Candidatus Lokiarchaeota archaeon]